MSVKQRTYPQPKKERQLQPQALALPPTDTPSEIWVPVPGQQRRSRQPHPQRRWRWGWLLVMALFLLALVGGLVTVIGTGLFYRSDWILPGTQVMGVAVGGQTQATATAVLQEQWAQRQVVLDAGEKEWRVSPSTLGMSLKATATVALAYQQGRTLSSLEQILLSGGDLRVPPIWTFDATTAESHLATLAAELEVAPVNAGVAFANGQLDVTAPRPGQTLDLAATMAWLTQNPTQALQDGRVGLITTAVQPQVTDVNAARAKLSELLPTAVTIHAYDPVQNQAQDWPVGPEVWSQWLSLQMSQDGSRQLVWVMDEAQAEAALAGQTAVVGEGQSVNVAEVVTAVGQAITHNNATVNTRIYHQPRQHTVQNGETLSGIGYAYGVPYPWIQHANPGLGNTLSVGQMLTIPSPDDLLPFPVVENKRILISLSQQKVWAYENGQLKWEWLGSTGIASSPTAPGIFQIQSHELEAYAGNWNLYMPYFMGIYKPAPSVDFMNGFHGFPTRDGYNLLWTGDLGHEVTYGCVLISSDNAALLYDWAEQGVVVEIQP